MCGRYLTPERAALERQWGLPVPPGFVPSYNVAPSQSAPVVRADEHGGWALGMLIWGFQPDWAQRPWINVRSETVFTAKAFAGAARKRRCLVPAIGWYEWQAANPMRQPFVFHLDGFPPLAFAGIWTGRKMADDWQRSFAILTMEASSPFRDIHHRKPVVVAPDAFDLWMDRNAAEQDLRRVLEQPAAGISAYPVTRYVNKPANDDPRCIQPANSTRGDPGPSI